MCGVWLCGVWLCGVWVCGAWLCGLWPCGEWPCGEWPWFPMLRSGACALRCFQDMEGVIKHGRSIPNRESSMRKRRAWRSRRRARAGAGAGAGAARHSAPLPHHDLRHVSTLAPELGVHVVLTHLVGTRLATPAVVIRAVVGGDRGRPGASTGTSPSQR